MKHVINKFNHNVFVLSLSLSSLLSQFLCVSLFLLCVEEGFFEVASFSASHFEKSWGWLSSLIPVCEISTYHVSNGIPKLYPDFAPASRPILPHTVYCLLCPVYCIMFALCTMYCELCTVYCTRAAKNNFTVRCELLSVNVYYILRTVYCALHTVCCVLCFGSEENLYRALCPLFCVMYTVYNTQFTVYCVLYTVYCVQCTILAQRRKSLLCAVYCFL